MIHLYTGDGKGKTTAAIGLAVRAAGSGMRVIFSQFMKGNDSGELHGLAQLSRVEIWRSDRQFGFYRTLSDEDKAALTDIHNELLDRILDAVEKKECDMVILDEITYPVNWELLAVAKLERLLDLAKEAGETTIELVLTGRNPAQFLVDAADYVTRMEALRHPFEKGVRARKGIEY